MASVTTVTTRARDARWRRRHVDLCRTASGMCRS
ncbi:putative leader peptide [Rhodococcus tukisamuensis]